MKKLLSVMLAVTLLATMSLSVFADAATFTTTVSYDLSSGNAEVETSGTASAGSQVSHLLYTGSGASLVPLYVDQKAAEADGSFEFTYTVAGQSVANLQAATTAVGTDGAKLFATNSNKVGALTIDLNKLTNHGDAIADAQVIVDKEFAGADGVAAGTKIAVASKIVNLVTNCSEFGVIFYPGTTYTLNKDTEGAYILAAMGGNAYGDWEIGIVDKNNKISNYTLVTYTLNANGGYTYGTLKTGSVE